MKIDSQLPATRAIDPKERQAPRPQPGDQVLPREGQRAPREAPSDKTTVELRKSRSTGYSLQLNRQLSSMQSADSYLSELAEQLTQLKMALSRSLSSSDSGEQQAVRALIDRVAGLLEKRAEGAAGSLDSNLRLTLNEPVRTRFSLPGLDSLAAVQANGSETLLFKAGRQSSEPLVVVLEQDMSAELLLRRLNAAFGRIGARAELDEQGALRFSVRETDWAQLREGLQARGEGGLYPVAQFQPLVPEQEQLLSLPQGRPLESFQEVRRVLDSVVRTLDRIQILRDQLAQRQQEIRQFLERQSDLDEQQWAHDYARKVYELMHKASANYATVSQTVVAQANLSRFAVVSLLS